MISFVTLSRDAARYLDLTAGISACFAGAPYLEPEVILVDGNRHDLFSGYDHGAKEAENEVVAFLHDDVRLLCNYTVFERPLALLKKPFTGFVGVAGALQLGKDGCWWRQDHTLLRGGAAHPGAGEFGIHWNVWPFQAGQFGRVAVLDGVFLMTTKSTLASIGGFSQGYLTGFHFYDLCATLRASLSGRSNYVAPIPLLHLSHGETNEGWDANRQAFASRYASRLPFGVSS